MPELPEVETVCRGLAPVLTGRKIAAAKTHRPDLREPFPPRFAAKLTGRRVEAVERRGKYWLWRLDDKVVVLGHLGMSGSFAVAPKGTEIAADRHHHLTLSLDDGTTIAYRDPRRFGRITLTTTAELADHPWLAALGPEPLGPEFSGRHLAAALAGRKTAIKPALLDQTVVAGMGNIYASESLFRARIAPTRTAGRIGGKTAQRLAGAIREVLTEAIAAGGSSLRDHRTVAGELGEFQHAFAVYDRAGRACPGCACDLTRTGGIRRIVQAGRATFFCPHHQK